MGETGATAGTRAITYCLVPRDLADKLHEPLRAQFHGTGVEVVVERRRSDRRARPDRRAASSDERACERRAVRSADGRRVADRRAMALPTGAPSELPKKARRYADRLVFVERIEPSAQRLRDADSKRLVVRYQSGDSAAFEELYMRYFNAVYSYAKVALADHHEAEDVTQQVFVRASGALARYELLRNVPFRGWLFSIARNVLATVLSGRHDMTLEAPGQLESLRERRADRPIPAAAEALEWLSDREIAMFVERLPLAQRQVLVLRFMLDLSGAETAQVLGRTHSSVRQLQARALLTLQRRLAAVGRTSSRRSGAPMWTRLRGGPVIVRRRFALATRPSHVR